MNFGLLFFLTVSVIHTKSTVVAPDQVNINLFDLMRMALLDVGQWMKTQGFDEIDLPNITESEYSLYLTNGILSNLHDINQHLDTQVTYRDSAMYIQMGITFKKLFYEYTAKILGFSPTGSIGGSIENVKLNLHLRIDLTNMEINLVRYESSIGTIHVELHGNRLYDWLANSIIQIVKPKIKWKLEDLLAVEVKNLLVEYLSFKFV